MVENRVIWSGHVERSHIDYMVRRVDHMERSQTIRGKVRPRKTIREFIKKYPKINDLDRNIVLDRTSWKNFIYVSNPT